MTPAHAIGRGGTYLVCVVVGLLVLFATHSASWALVALLSLNLIAQLLHDIVEAVNRR